MICEALRIVLQCLESHANRYGRYIVPLLSLSADFYVRLVVRVLSGKAKVKETFTKVSIVYQCVGCETVTLHPMGRIITNKKSIKHQVSQGPPVAQSCVHCGHRHIIGGPIWSAPIHNRTS
ncbi:putative tRNA (guanine(26)-N(2))-dimethyltransferase [Chionoecetes opilio]|uniref:tRNA (guanine(26)-N(2))-dimethyltransferase n=1 Tax=Chionoecetes opilio TaxID=41210 RepID=A0A8J5CPT7_CHIOP|nr:putative tRNA (guanine(26)-N(2))-dimethyltransferase [Chionoecetes opilio]